MSYACVAAGVSRQVAYKTRAENEAFAEDWASALEIAADVLEREAHRRAVDGVAEPVYYKGQLAGAVRRYSDSLLMFLLRARRTQVFSERYRLEVAAQPEWGMTPGRLVCREPPGPGGIPMDRWNEIMASAADRAAAREAES